MSELFRAHNDGLAIARIPSEILCQIFLYYASEQRHSHTVGPDWISITHVCHHWRLIALDLANLWTEIGSGPLKFNELLLSRSKQDSLKLVVPYLEPPDIIAKAFREAHRLETVDISSVFEYPPLPDSLFAPRLHSIALTHWGQATSLSPHFQNYDMPRLGRVKLAGYEINWSSRLFCPTLTSLDISDVIVHPGLEETLYALSKLPKLTFLSLNNIFPTDSRVKPVSADVDVALPLLEVLKLSCGPGVMASFLSHVSFPPNARLFLQTHTTSHRPVSGLASVLSSHLVALQELENGNSLICAGVNIVGNRMELKSYFEENPTREEPVFEIAVVCRDGVDMEDVMEKLFSQLPLGAVRVFRMGCVMCFVNILSAFQEFLNHMVDLKELHVDGSSITWLAYILWYRTYDGVSVCSPSSRTIPLPHLRVLSIEEATLPRAWGNDYLHRHLADAFLSRKGRSPCFTTLVLKNHHTHGDATKTKVLLNALVEMCGDQSTISCTSKDIGSSVVYTFHKDSHASELPLAATITQTRSRHRWCGFTSFGFNFPTFKLMLTAYVVSCVAKLVP